MNVTLAVYRRKREGTLEWTTLGLGKHTVRLQARSNVQVQRAVTDRLKNIIEELRPRELEPFQLARGIELERVPLEITLRNDERRRRVAGHFPLIIEPRWSSPGERVRLVYHPYHQHLWFPLDPEQPLDEQARAFFQAELRELGDDVADELTTDGKDSIGIVSFTAEPKMLLDELPRPGEERRRGIAFGTRGERREPVLPQIGSDETLRVLDESVPLGRPRQPWRNQLQLLLCTEKPRPVLLVGPPGVGKTTLLYRAISDRLLYEDWESHRNLDRVGHVWSIAGRRIIAGMSYLGDWEQRCIDLLDEVRGKRVILWAEDIHRFGWIGRTRDSDRNLADLLTGPLARGELTLIGECTPEQLGVLEEVAPSFAAVFTTLHLAPMGSTETLATMLHEVRRLERAHHVRFDPFALRTILDLGGALQPRSALPGKALGLLRRIARENEGAAPTSTRWIAPAAVIGHLSARTGLPRALLAPDEGTFDVGGVEKDLSARVIGQAHAVSSVIDLIVRIRTGLTDPRRPYGVYLFTGPTGTGKTELARALAAFLYGGEERLARFDMGELSGPDAVARLIGDAWSPSGMLTRRVRDQPFCVILLDEIEKAHPAVLNLLLQVFDEARLTDASGDVADFTHTVIVMTSNLGARTSAPTGFGADAASWAHDAERAVKQFFPPELFNRIDRVIPFRALDEATAKRVARKELGRLLGRRGLIERNVLVWATGRVVDRIAREGFDVRAGARSLKKWLEDQVGTILATELGERPAAALRLGLLHERGDALRLHVDAVTEAPPHGTRSAMEELVHLPLSDLRERVPEAISRMSRIVDGEAMQRVAEELSARMSEGGLHDPRRAARVWALDELRRGAAAHRGKLGAYSQRKGRAVREDLLRAIGEVRFWERAAKNVDDESQHGVRIELLRHWRLAGPTTGSRQHGGMLEWLLQAYVRHAGVPEAIAARLNTGAIVHGKGAWHVHTAGRQGDHVIADFAGLCVRDRFEGEVGCHLWAPVGYIPDAVRVRILPLEGAGPPEAALAAHAAARKAFESAIEEGPAGAPIPPNPEAPLPAIRLVRCPTPRSNTEPMPIEIEDYALAWADELHARTPTDPIYTALTLALARE